MCSALFPARVSPKRWSGPVGSRLTKLEGPLALGWFHMERGRGGCHLVTHFALFSMLTSFRDVRESFRVQTAWLGQRGTTIHHLVDRTSVLGSKSSQNGSEHVGTEARMCGGPVRGGIELETHHDSHRFRCREVLEACGHCCTMPRAGNGQNGLGMVPKHVQMRRVQCWNVSRG